MLAAHDLTFDALADDGLVIAGQPIRLRLAAANHGAIRCRRDRRRHRRLRRPGQLRAGRSARRTPSTPAPPKRTFPRDAKLTTPVLQRQLLEASGEPGDPDFRSGRAVRRSLRAHAVPRDLPREGRRRGGHQGIADRVPLREGHLLRRQAHGAERGAGVFGAASRRPWR